MSMEYRVYSEYGVYSSMEYIMSIFNEYRVYSEYRV